MTEVWREVDRLYRCGCRRFFLSEGDWRRFERELDQRTSREEDPNRKILESLGFLEPPPKRPFVNLKWNGCPVLWNDFLEDLPA